MSRYELCEICGREYDKKHAPIGLLCECGKPAVHICYPLGLLWYECEECHNSHPEGYVDVSWKLAEIPPCLERYIAKHPGNENVGRDWCGWRNPRKSTQIALDMEG